jgi:type I restriction enzyme S subunit
MSHGSKWAHGFRVLISITADIGIVSFIDDKIPLPAYINQHIALVRFDQSKIDGQYASYYLAAEASQKWFRGLTDTGAKAGMSLPTIRKIQFACPPPTEQRTIAAALSDIDALISGLDQLIAKKRDLKQATMQALLTGQRRLPSFSGVWVRKRLVDVFSIFAGKSKSAFVSPNGRYWIVDMGSVSINGKLIVSKATNYCSDFLKFGDLIMPKDDIGGGNIIGKVGYIDADNKYILGDHVYCLRAKQGHPLFLSYVINGHATNSALRKKVIGSAQLGLGRRSVEEQEIPFPDPSEQSAIATVLSNMDAELKALETRRDKAIVLKQGTAQELLTGRIRLV